jgi:hypothetical protein
MYDISARKRDGGNWGDCEFRARSIGTAIKTAAKKLGLKGPITTREQVGSSQWAVNVDGTMMMIIIDKA